MKKTRKILFLDPQSIDKFNYENFINSLDWPFKDEEFQNFSNYLLYRYYNLLKKKSNYIFYAGLIETSMIDIILNIANYNYAVSYCKKHNIKQIFSLQSNHFRKPIWKNIENFYNIQSFPHKKNKRKLRRYIKIILFNKKLKLIKYIFSKDKKAIVSLGSFDHLKKKYLENENNICKFYDWIDLLNDKNKKNNYAEREKIKKILEDINNRILIPFISDIFTNKDTRKFLIGLNKKILIKTWTKRFEDIIRLLVKLEDLKIVKKLLISETNNPFHKIIKYSCYLKGANIIDFSHGNEFGALSLRWGHQSLISHSFNYCFENKEIKNNFIKTKKFRPTEKITKTKYISLESSYFENIRKASKNKIIKFHNNVMLIGFPMHTNRYIESPYSFFHYKLKLEILISKILKNSRYYSIYKAHPSRLKELGSILTDKFDSIETKNFEKVWRKAGVLIFTSLGSTTLGYALNLPIPIVYINSEGTPLNKDILKKLKKRVAVVSNYYKNGKNTINNNNLYEAISQSKKLVNLNVTKKITG